jgi:phosphoserine phosphatase
MSRIEVSNGRRVDLVCFDVDGTLVEHPEGKVVWQLLNRRFLGDDSINRDRLRAYREGRITYPEWVELDVGDWVARNATREQMVEAMAELRLVPGARETLAELGRRGYGLAVISGTLDLTLEHLFPDHPFEEVHTNRVEFDEAGRLVGWAATPFDMDGKALALREMARRRDLPLERCAFVGDHLNDVEVAREAGYSVAFRPKCEELREVADLVLEEADLRSLLPHFP